MHRLAVLGSVVTIALVGLLAAGRAAGTVAQEGTPPANGFELPEGVTFEGLAFGLAEACRPARPASRSTAPGSDPAPGSSSSPTPRTS